MSKLIDRNAVYACIVTSVTIGMSSNGAHRWLMVGFGDFSPVTPAGRVFFIPFVLLAVPIVTSFAVQTITGLVGPTLSVKRDQMLIGSSVHSPTDGMSRTLSAMQQQPGQTGVGHTRS